MAPERKKVLFLIPSLKGGGAERVLSILLRNLDRNCFDLHLGILQAEGAYLGDLPAHAVVHDLQINRVRYALPGVVRLIWKLRPQAVMSILRPLNLLLILSKPFLPGGTKVLVRETAVPSPTLENETDRPWVWRWLYRHLYRRADAVVGLSDAMVNDLIENFNVPAERIVRIYNPVDRQRVRELAEIGPNPYSGPGPHLVAAGRFSREKGLDVLLAAMPAVIRRFPKTELVVLGEGPLKEELIGQMHQLRLAQHVHFMGFEPNPWRYFRHADLLILPSRYEALPNVLLEALVLGTRVIATDCPGGVREIQACDPEMTLTAPEDPEALAGAILSACNEGNKQQQRSLPDLSKFDLQEAIREYSRLF